MRKFYKKLALLGAALALSASLVACGGKKETSSSLLEKKEFVYVPQYETIEGTSDFYRISLSNNSIYYYTWFYNEADDTYTTELKVIGVGEKEGKTLPIKFNEGEDVSTFSVDKDGNIFMVLNTYLTDENNPDNYNQFYTLKKFDKDGNELLVKDLSDLTKNIDESYIQYIALDDAGNIFLSNGSNRIWALDASGNDLFTLEVDNYIYGLGTSKEGKVLAGVYEEDKIILKDIDVASKGFGANYENIPPSNGAFTIIKGLDKGCLFNTGSALFEYDLETQTSKEVLNWIDCDIDSNNISAVLGLDDGRILAIVSDYSEEKPKTDFVYLTKTKSSEVAEKTTITFGCMYMSSNVRSEIINFNKTNEKYRIRVKEYFGDDYEAGIAQFNSDIVSGNGPDVIDLSIGGINQYIEKGILENLTPFFESDTQLKKDDYIGSVLSAFERDGKLYAILPSFSINTIIGKTADVGSEMGWTINDLIALADSRPDAEVFSYTTKENMLSVLSDYGLDEFIDWSTGKCSFDSEDFIKILEFCNRFKSEAEFVYDENEPSTPSKIRDGKLLLMMTNINDVQSFQMYSLMFGEPVTFIGYPTSSGKGSAISPSEITLGVSSKSKNKEGAWEFVRTFLTPEYQTKEYLWGFPVLKSALDEKLNKAMEPEFYTDESGNQVKSPKTTWGYDDAEFEIYEATQEDVDAIKFLIDNVDSVYDYNTEIYKILSEEAAPFFTGQKSAKDVAAIIQSRVQIYVNENR